eukprot:SAG25_NODE_6915_length_519_cov_0.790476_1_plen_31_part_10
MHYRDNVAFVFQPFWLFFLVHLIGIHPTVVA